jgi:Lar family restriction alleviation protein
MSDLKPCPFCGCTTIKRIEHINGVVHHCDWCDATGPFEGVFDGVKQGWNTRATLAEIKGDIHD